MSARKTPISAILIALILVLGIGAAMARGMPPATGQAEICQGSAAVTLYLDANGNPTANPHLCADFALSLLAHVAAAPVELNVSRTYQRSKPPWFAVVPPTAPLNLHLWPRAPPAV